MKRFFIVAVLSTRSFCGAKDVLVPNNKGSPMILPNVCGAQGRTGKCEVEVDVSKNCGSPSDCPVVFFFHGAGGTNNGFNKNSNVHEAGYIGVYPQGENGWNTGPKNTNQCDWSDFSCLVDPDEGDFVASIIEDLRNRGAKGHVYAIGNSNGAALAHRLAANADGFDGVLPIAGIVTTVTQLLDSPERNGPGILNYNQPRKGETAKVAVLNVMGTGDNLIPYEGGGSGVFAGEDAFQLKSALASMETWAAHNGCETKPEIKTGLTTDDKGGTGADFYAYPDCDGGLVVEHYALLGAAHNAGAASIEGKKINYEIAFDFIDRVEKALEKGTEKPNKVPTKPPNSYPNKVPTMPPSTAPSDDGNGGDDYEDEEPGSIQEQIVAIINLVFELFTSILAILSGGGGAGSE